MKTVTIRKWMAPHSNITRYYFSANGRSVGYVQQTIGRRGHGGDTRLGNLDEVTDELVRADREFIEAFVERYGQNWDACFRATQNGEVLQC